MIRGHWTLNNGRDEWIYFNTSDDLSDQITIRCSNCDRIDLPKSRLLMDSSIGLNLVIVPVEQARKAWDELIEQGWFVYTPQPRRSSRTPFKKISSEFLDDVIAASGCYEKALEVIRETLDNMEVSEYVTDQGNQG